MISINHVLKSRARRYIAAAAEEWLYPEQVGAAEWNDLGKILLPPERELWHFGGEIVVGYKDGTSSFQDAFGRTSSANEYLRKEPPSADPAPDEPCPCGSGQSYALCCTRLSSSSTVLAGPPELRENYGFRAARLTKIRAGLAARVPHLCTEWSRIHGKP